MLRNRFSLGLGASLLGALALSVMVDAAAPAPVADAAMDGDTKTVRALLKSAADVNAAQGDGMTALHWAAMRGDAELAQVLLYAGANVKAETRIGGYTPLFLAAKNGRATTVEALLKSGADPKTATTNGTTALMAAAASGDVPTIEVLLKNGSDPNVVEPVRGNTAIMFAAANNRAEAIRVLSQHGADMKATTKVVDLSGLTRESLGFVGGNPPVPGQEGQQGGNRSVPSAAEKNGGTGPVAAEPNAKPSAGAGNQPAAAAQPAAAPAAGGRKPQVAGVDRQFQLNELVAAQGGLTPLLYAVRQGHVEAVSALLESGADVNQLSAGDRTSPLLMAIINGHFDIASTLLDKGADPNVASENGAGPLYAVLNVEWAPKALYPQPRAYQQQRLTHIDMLRKLLDKGADPNVRLNKKVWYSGYSFDLSGVDEIGATPFWRAAYGADVDAMKLLIEHGADPNIPTMKPAGRPRTGDSEREVKETSTLPPVPVGGPSVTPLQAAAGVGYGEGFAANSHRFAPAGLMTAVKYLVEETGADVNAVDHEGNTALHHAASRGDTEMILYLVSKGADVKAINREGKSTADMANGPVQRTQPYPEALALLEKLGAVNNHKCVSC